MWLETSYSNKIRALVYTRPPRYHPSNLSITPLVPLSSQFILPLPTLPSTTIPSCEFRLSNFRNPKNSPLRPRPPRNVRGASVFAYTIRRLTWLNPSLQIYNIVKRSVTEREKHNQKNSKEWFAICNERKLFQNYFIW